MSERLETITEAAGRHGIPRHQLDQWCRLTGVKRAGTVKQLAGGMVRDVFAFRTADIDAAVARYMPPAGWMTVRQLAEANGKSVQLIHKLIGEGRLATATRGRTHYLPPDALANVLPPNNLPKPTRNTNNRPRPAEPADGDDRDGRTPDDGYGPEVPFGASGLTLYAADLTHLQRVRAGVLARRGREGK